MNEIFEIYTAGGIKPPDFGIPNRRRLEKLFADSDKIELVSPCDFESNLRNIKNGYNLNNAMEKNPHMIWQDVLKNIIKPVADDDMHAVINGHGVICIMDYTMGSGTSGEVTTAKTLGKPVWGWITENTDIRKVKPWILNQMTSISFDLNNLKYEVESYVERHCAIAK